MKDPARSLLSLEQAVRWRQALRRNGRRLAVTNGCFDLLHRGHASYLLEARGCADALLVLLNSDASVRALKGPSRPLNTEQDRAYLLASLRAVDRVVVFDSPRCDAELAALSPDVYVKAGDYTLEKLDPGERKALLDAGAEIVFMPFVPGHSTTGIVEKIRKKD
ncbi:MAG: adenylyltransferase/cytidyltransferase family protein [Lentisphaeria bacterium]|nr:adenylyltransferase/cytidyltransferase family protein [Lentisphaeria bacterium]